MNHKKSLLLLVLSVLLLVPASAFAATSSKTAVSAVTTSKIKSIYFTNHSFAQLKNVQLLNTNGQNVLSYSLTIHNGDKQALNYYDYFMQVTSKSGTDYTVNLVPSNELQKTIEPGQDVTYQYYAVVSDSTNLSDLIFNWTKWDFSATTFKRIIGKMTVPSNYDIATSENKDAAFNAGDLNLSAKISHYGVTSNTSYTFPSITVDLKNLEHGSIQPPTLQYFIKTESGALYPLDVKLSHQAGQLKPLDIEKAYLSGSIPKDVSMKNSDLIIASSVTIGAGTQMTLPVTSFKLGNDVTTVISKGDFVYTSDSGIYHIKLNAVHRLPWQDQDLLIANVTVTNDGATSLPTFNIGGSFILDDNIQVKANAILLDKIIAIQPKQAAHYRLIAKIPYTYTFSKLGLQLQDLDQGSDIIQFTKNGELDTIPVIDVNSSYTYDGTGRQFKLSTQSVDMYNGNTSDIYSTSLDLKNLEKRFTDIPSLSARFVDKNGIVYPAQLEKVDGKAVPGGDALVQAWTTLPKGTDTEGMQLIVGEAASGNALTTTGDTPDAYVNAVKLGLPTENGPTTSTLSDMKIGSFSLEISNVSWPSMYFNRSTSLYDVTVNLDYTLNKDLLLQTNVSDHHYLIVLEDANGKQLLSKEISINSSSPTSGSNLSLGSDSIQVSSQVSSLSYNSSSYTLKIYDEFQSGYLKLLGSKKL